MSDGLQIRFQFSSFSSVHQKHLGRQLVQCGRYFSANACQEQSAIKDDDQMQAYVPPHRRQQTLAISPPKNQQDIPTVLDDGIVGQSNSPSSSKGRSSPKYGVLLQAHGDSFVGPLTQLKEDLIDVRRYSGATAKGLNNVQSSQRVGQRMMSYLDNTRPGKVRPCRSFLCW